MTTNNNDTARCLTHHEQMRNAVEIAARKVVKQPKTETPTEMFLRIRVETDSKKNKSIKRAGKALVKNKKVQKMTAYFTKKQHLK